MASRLFDLHAVGVSFDVCCVGNAIVDIIANCDETFLTSLNMTKGSMALIDEERASFLYDRLGPAVESSGGSAANTAVGIAALGGKPAYIGKVKQDQLGDIFCHDMKAMGVHYPIPPIEQGPSTGRCLIFVTPDGQRTMNTYLGAAVEFGPSDIDPEPIRNAQITYLEGYLFDKPPAQAAFGLAAQIAHAADRQLALTLSDSFCVERHRQAFRDLIKEQVDILFANEQELTALYQTSSFDEAVSAAREDCFTVVATRSAQGAVLACGEEVVQIKAEPVDVVVDTTGAGDLFAAGFLFGATQGFGLPVCGKIAAAAAAEIISHFGPRPQKDLKETLRFLGLEKR